MVFFLTEDFQIAAFLVITLVLITVFVYHSQRYLDC